MPEPTNPAHHPTDAVLLDYAAGTMDVAHYRVVATHLSRCAGCRTVVRFCEDVKHTMLAAVPAVPPPPDLLDRCLRSIGRRGPDRDGRTGPGAAEPPPSFGGLELPSSLRGLRTGRLRWLAPGIRHGTLWHDERSTLHLLRVSPGVSLPAHRHRGLELTCVLRGAYRTGGRLHAAGDLGEEEDDGGRNGPDHLVVAEPPDDCVCIVATTGRLRFSGPVARLLQPVMPF